MKSFVHVLVAIAVLQLPFAAGDVDDEEVSALEKQTVAMEVL